MIRSVEGLLAQVGDADVQVNVGGIGLRVQTTPSVVAQLASKLGSVQQLHTSFVVREDQLTLYGFADEDDLDVFDVLMTVSGIGPRLALAAIDVLGSDGLRSALVNEDTAALVKIPGVGKKTAQRMLLEIGDKLGAPTTSGVSRVASDDTREAVEAGLEQLGWPKAVARKAIDSLEGQYEDVESMLRAALGVLGNKRG